MHPLGPVLRQVGGQDAAHRQAAGDDDVALLLEPIMGRLDAGVPLLPRRAAKLLGRGAVAGQLTARDGVTGAGETMGHEPDLGRRTAEAMNQEHAEAPTADELAAVPHLRVRGLFLLLLCQVSMHAGSSPVLSFACCSPLEASVQLSIMTRPLAPTRSL